jgi:hypothetical protein
VQVLQHQDQRPLPAQPLEQIHQDLEEPAPAQLAEEGLGSGLAQLGQQPGQIVAAGAEQAVHLVRREVTYQGPERGHDRRERQPVLAQLGAGSDQHPRPRVAGAGQKLLHQPGLAHPGLATDQHHRRLSGHGLGQPGPQGVELALAPHEDGADRPACHIREHATEVRQFRPDFGSRSHPVRHPAPLRTWWRPTGAARE